MLLVYSWPWSYTVQVQLVHLRITCVLLSVVHSTLPCYGCCNVSFDGHRSMAYTLIVKASAGSQHSLTTGITY